MLHRLRFYLIYALRNIQRGGRWTTLAILCISAGVGTVVALRTLGLAVGDTLINNVRIETKGDLLIRNDAAFTAFGSNDPRAFSPEELAALQAWAGDKGAKTAAFMTGRNVQLSKAEQDQFGRPSFIGSFFIDSQTYPPTHTIHALDPPDTPLRELFSGGSDVVISENLASTSGLEVGDSVRVTGTDALYTVRGIVSAAEESSVSNFLNAFFGFAYFDLRNASEIINEGFAPNRIGVVLPAAIDEAEAARLVGEIEAIAPDARVDTTFERLARYQDISQYLGDFVVVMGLGALLIGGVGIMNTMLVLVRRRTTEIAAIKTFGLQARQVAALFLMEGLLLGLVGSALGMVAGIGLSVIVNEYGSVALRQPLIWRVYPEALIFGFGMGMVVTAIFSVAPILTAVRVRPNIILRPNENQLAALGLLQSLLLLVFVTISLGLIVGHILSPSFQLISERSSDGFGFRGGPPRDRSADDLDAPEEPVTAETQAVSAAVPNPYAIGVAGVAFTFVIFAVLIGALWCIVLLLGRLPSFGFVTLRLALRNMSTGRLRTATTILALSAGMLALSSIAFVGEGTRELLNLQLSRTFGGNVLVFPFPGLPSSMIDRALESALADVDLQYSSSITSYESTVRDYPLDFDVWQSDNPDIYAGQPALDAGRMLTPDDAGQPIIVLPAAAAEALDLTVDDRVSLALDGETLDLRVVGVITGVSVFGESDPRGVVPPGVVPSGTESQFKLYSYAVPEAELNRALTELSAVIFAFAIDVQFIDSLIGRLIDQFAAIPTIVGLLSLFAAAVIMANTVALSTLERRRQIGILKAIGLKSWKALRVMLIESSVVGLLSAVIGIGGSALIIEILSQSGGIDIPLPVDAGIVAVALLVAAIVIGWVATFLSARVALGERVMNVLRYD